MANSITNDASRGRYGESLKMSNGGTSVFLSVMLLAGSDFAKSEWEKLLMYWLAEKDIGGGVVGFDIADIPWRSSTFCEQKQFVLETIGRACQRYRWDALEYDPPLVPHYLAVFRDLVEEFSETFIGESVEWNFIVEPQGLQRCAVHNVYLHRLNPDPLKCCLLCNDSPSGL
jgi:hypothetical protein